MTQYKTNIERYCQDLTLPKLWMYPHPEETLRQFHQHLPITSILDVGAGHGGVFDKHHWDNLSTVNRRVACDIHWIRDHGPLWEVKTGVDVQELDKHFGPQSFDWVQCMETLEHVADPELGLGQLMSVAKVGVVITSWDETHHLGDEQNAIEKVNPNQAYRRQPKVEWMQKNGWQCYLNAETATDNPAEIAHQIIGVWLRK